MGKNARSAMTKWATPLWPATVTGIVVGAALGGFAMLGAAPETGATALVRIDQPIDPNQIMTNTAPSSDTQQSYISGEVAYLTSPGFSDAVAKELNQVAKPSVTAVQTGASSVISLSSEGATFTEAQRTIDAAVKVYSDHAHQQIRERGQAAMDAITNVMNGLQTEINDSKLQAQQNGTNYDENGWPVDQGGTLNGQTGTGMTGQPLDSRLARINQLELERTSIDVQTQRAPGIQVVQPPVKTTTQGAPGWSLGAIGGGLLGGLVALSVSFAIRKRSGVITSPAMLDGEFGPVLMPVVTLTKAISADDDPTEEEAAVARSIYAQLPAPRSGHILLVGASADSGTAAVARLLAFAAADHESATMVHLPNASETFDAMEPLMVMAPADPQATATFVIDGGSLDSTPALPEVATHADQIIIVATIGSDVLSAARMAGQLARSSDVPVSVVCTRKRWWSRASKRTGTVTRPQSRHSAKGRTGNGPAVTSTETEEIRPYDADAMVDDNV